MWCKDRLWWRFVCFQSTQWCVVLLVLLTRLCPSLFGIRLMFLWWWVKSVVLKWGYGCRGFQRGTFLVSFIHTLQLQWFNPKREQSPWFTFPLWIQVEFSLLRRSLITPPAPRSSYSHSPTYYTSLSLSGISFHLALHYSNPQIP